VTDAVDGIMTAAWRGAAGDPQALRERKRYPWLMALARRLWCWSRVWPCHSREGGEPLGCAWAANAARSPWPCTAASPSSSATPSRARARRRLKKASGTFGLSGWGARRPTSLRSPPGTWCVAASVILDIAHDAYRNPSQQSSQAPRQCRQGPPEARGALTTNSRRRARNRGKRSRLHARPVLPRQRVVAVAPPASVGTASPKG